MKNIGTLVTAFFLLIQIASAEEARTKVATLNFSEIQGLLEEVVLSAPGNEKLSERYKAAKAKEKSMQLKMQKAMMSGERFDPLEAASGVLNPPVDKSKVDLLCEKQLLEILEKLFEEKYDLILKGGYRSSIFYTRIPIDDVTSLVKQQLLKELPGE